MATTSYITPIIDRTYEDVQYARTHQSDLTNKNKGAWNYTDANRVCNNLKYAAEYMYEQGFLQTPYQMSVKTDWKESDIITYEQLNSMIVNNMNNLKTYARQDINWYYIASIANMDYNTANWLERNIHALATQEPLPPDKFTLTVNNGTGGGEYTANTIVSIRADNPPEGQIFSHWSGDHLENIENASSAITTYRMPNQDITLTANYTSAIPHTLTVNTYTGTTTINLAMGDIYHIEADPAPDNKVFHHWEVNPSLYERNLYEQAATTTFTMPNEGVSLTAVYITKGDKQLVVNNGNGSGWYEYDTYVSVSSNKPINAVFTNWTGDTQYLSGAVTQEYNSIRIPDVARITITAHWTIPPATDVSVSIINGTFESTGESIGTFTQGDRVNIVASPAPEGQTFAGWSINGDSSVSNSGASRTTLTVGAETTTITATYRQLEYHTLTVTTNSGTTSTTKEKYEYFEVNANPIPEGYLFDRWTGDTSGFNGAWFYTTDAITGTYMGGSDRTIVATYRIREQHTLTVHQPSGDVTYTDYEGNTVSINADPPPTGKVFSYWELSDSGYINLYYSSPTTYRFRTGDGELTPHYQDVVNVSVVNGTINWYSTSGTYQVGERVYIQCRSLALDEKFDGWTLNGTGTIENSAAPETRFVVGNTNTVLTANISKYPDRTLKIYYQDPDTGVNTLVSSNTYSHGSRVRIEAPVAPNETTFLTWLGDTDLLSAGTAGASSTYIPNLTKDATLIATYYYPEAPEYYTLTVYDGYPESGSYAAGSQVTINAKMPAQGWEFYKWYGDVQFLVNPDLTLSENAVIIPQRAVTIYAKFKVIGELPLYRVTVSNGIASGTYITGEGTEDEQVHNESGIYIDVPAGTQVTLTADASPAGYAFDHWEGNFEAAGVIDINTTINPTTFTMVENDLNIQMIRKEVGTYTVYPTNATGPGTTYPGVYTIAGNLRDTEDRHYTFTHWTCVDVNGNNCISAIADPNNVETTITLVDKDLWIEAHYITHYKLTVVNSQDSGDGYYYEGEIVNSIRANDPPSGSGLQFDYWDDPMGVIENIYDPTPTVTMGNSPATITAHFGSSTSESNSIVVTGNALHTNIITRRQTSLISGVFAVGTIVFDRDGCIGVITEVDPDHSDDTDDYRTQKLFYGGNF